MDRIPKPAPYAIGTKLRYRGIHESYNVTYVNGAEVLKPIIHPGMEVVVSTTKPGRHGTLRHLRDTEGPLYDDSGDPVLDHTIDAYSVYDSPGGGRIIWPDDAAEWEVIGG